MTENVDEQASAPTWNGAGIRLKRERESQGLSLFEAARALRLSEKQVAALEADDYAQLPGRTFVRGFVRNYARLVQLDPEPLMALLSFGEEEGAHMIQVPSQKISFSEHHGKPWLKWLLMMFVFVAVLSWGVLEWLGPEKPVRGELPRAALSTNPSSQHKAPEPPVGDVSVTPEPVAAPILAPVSAPITPQSAVPVIPPAPATAMEKLTMTFSGRAWVEIRDKNGKIIHSQNNAAGVEQVVEGEGPLSLVVGNAPNVKLIYKGKPVDLSAFAKADVARLILE